MMTITIATIVGAAVTATGDATDARRRALRPISWLTGVQMRFFTVSASAALLMLGTAAASAQTAQTAPDAYDDAQEQTAATQRVLDRTFGNIDENGDGTIDRPEWGALLTDWLAERRDRQSIE